MADEFVLKCSLLSTILKSKATMFGALASGASVQNKTVTAVAFPNIDKAVFAWLREQRANKAPLSGKVLQQEALNFTCMLDVVRREKKKKKCVQKENSRGMFWMPLT